MNSINWGLKNYWVLNRRSINWGLIRVLNGRGINWGLIRVLNGRGTSLRWVFGRNSNLNRTLSERRIFRQLNRQINWRRVVRFGRSWLNRINGLNAYRWVFRRCWIFHNRRRRYGWRGSTASPGLSGRRPIKCGSSLHPVVIALRGIRPILIAVVHPVVGNVTLDILSEVSYSTVVKMLNCTTIGKSNNSAMSQRHKVVIRKIYRGCPNWVVGYSRVWLLVVIVTTTIIIIRK